MLVLNSNRFRGMQKFQSEKLMYTCNSNILSNQQVMEECNNHIACYPMRDTFPPPIGKGIP